MGPLAVEELFTISLRFARPSLEEGQSLLIVYYIF